MPGANQFLSQEPSKSQVKGVTHGSMQGEPHGADMGIESQSPLLGQHRWLRQKSCTVLNGKQHLPGHLSLWSLLISKRGYSQRKTNPPQPPPETSLLSQSPWLETGASSCKEGCFVPLPKHPHKQTWTRRGSGFGCLSNQFSQ